MHLTHHCATSVLDFAHHLWTFVNSKEGQLVFWLILASHAFARSLINTGIPEAAEFSAAIVVAMLMFLLALATETGVVSLLMSDVQKCATGGSQIALLVPRGPVT
jgi:hypothetical protein